MRSKTIRTIPFLVLFFWLTITLTYGGSKKIFNENFDCGYKDWNSSIKVGGSFSIIERNSGRAIKVERKTIQGDNFTQLKYRIRPDVVKGKRLRVEALVRAENIAIGTKSYYGGHIDFEMRTPAGYVYESAPFFLDSFDWTKEAFECDIPVNIKTIDFRIGLQGAKGVIYFDDIKIFIID